MQSVKFVFIIFELKPSHDEQESSTKIMNLMVRTPGVRVGLYGWYCKNVYFFFLFFLI